MSSRMAHGSVPGMASPMRLTFWCDCDQLVPALLGARDSRPCARGTLPSASAIACLSLSPLSQPLGATSSLAELQLNEALLAIAEVMLSPWNASSASLYGPGTTITGEMLPSSEVISFLSSGSLLAPCAPRAPAPAGPRP